jgi:hypothetical protein
MDNKNNGGSAFPIQSLKQSGEQTVDNDFNYTEVGQKGMSLRDYFAAKAMQGLLSSPLLANIQATSEDLARVAYDHSDAMLKAREK